MGVPREGQKIKIQRLLMIKYLSTNYQTEHANCQEHSPSLVIRRICVIENPWEVKVM